MAGTPRDYNAIAPNFSSVKDQIDMYGGGGGGSDTPAKDIDWYNIFGCYEFDEESAYEVGDRVYVIWGDDEPRCYQYKTSHAAGPFSKLECDLIDPLLTLIEEGLDMIAPEFSDATNYAENDLVRYNGALYQFDFSHSAGAWTGTDVTQKDLSDIISMFYSKTDNLDTSVSDLYTMIAPKFRSYNAYAIGDIVMYFDEEDDRATLYKFTSAHTAGTNWDASEVTQTTLGEAIAAI